MFRFYEKATLIRQCQEKYEAAQIEYARATETLKEKTRSLRQLGAEFKKAHARWVILWFISVPVPVLRNTDKVFGAALFMRSGQSLLKPTYVWSF
jgi:hypothetical protein